EGGNRGQAPAGAGAPADGARPGDPRGTDADGPCREGRVRGPASLVRGSARPRCLEGARPAAVASGVAGDDRRAAGHPGGARRKAGARGRAPMSHGPHRLALVLPVLLLGGCATSYLSRAPASPTRPIIPQSSADEASGGPGPSPVEPAAGELVDEGAR